MASTIYTGTTSQTTTYAATDVYTLAVPTSSITNVAQQGANVVITTGATSFTILGVTLAQLANANFALQGGGAIQFGDSTAQTIADQFGQTIDFSTNNNGTVVLGLGGADTISAGNGANLIYGGSGVTDPSDGGDTIATGTGNDTIYGNGGNDSINSGGGADIVFGGVGLDTITTGALTGNVSVYGGGGFTDTTDGADSITIASNAGTLFATGNAGNDLITLSASTGSASVFGGIGADTINATVSAGNNLFAGGSATGTTDIDVINVTASGTANVTVFGGVGITDTVDGADNITVTGLAAGSTAFIYGNAGNDTISVGTAGTASVYGGVGTDSIVLQAGAATGRVQVFGGSSEGTAADTINGSAFLGNATIYGGNGLNDSADGADRILGGGGNDVIYGNGGADTIFSGAGTDQLSGGAGNDTFVIDGTGNKVISDFGVGTDSILIGGAFGTVTNVVATSTGVQISAGATNNIAINGTIPTTFTASFDANNDGVVDPAADGQILAATTSTATALVGTANADRIYGNTGADTIIAGAGADFVVGGAGADSITLGAGADTVVFTSLTGSDTITDYVVADDSIQIDNAVFTAVGGDGALAAGQFAVFANAAALTGGSVAASTDAQALIYLQDTGALYYNGDAGTAGGLTLIGTFTNTPVLANTEFTVI